MIRLTLAPEPAGFDAAVRQPGLHAIAEMVGAQPLVPRRGRRRQALWTRREDIPANKFPDYWTRTLDDLLREYQRLCALDQIQLEFSGDALMEIATAALRQKLGARSLRAILEKVLHPILFVAPERAGERIIIEPEDVRRVTSF